MHEGLSMRNFGFRRVTLFAGHYGSGKTNIAVNWALYLQGRGERTAICDLDIVNPYYRTKDSADDLEKAGIRLISSPYANSNVDFPALPQDIYALVERREEKAVFDIGGDDRGALALGRYTPYILAENDYEMIFVVNFYRPLTRRAEEALEVMREIEDAGGIPFTCIANNSNLGAETVPEDVLRSAGEVQRLSAMTGLEIKMTCAEARIAEQLDMDNVFPLKLQARPFESNR